MADENFYLDNPDLKFVMEQCVDWKSIIALREDIGSEDCPYEDADEARATFLEMIEDPVGSIAGQRIAPRAEEVDEIGCQFKDGAVVLQVGGQGSLAADDDTARELPAWNGQAGKATVHRVDVGLVERDQAIDGESVGPFHVDVPNVQLGPARNRSRWIAS